MGVFFGRINLMDWECINDDDFISANEGYGLDCFVWSEVFREWLSLFDTSGRI
jgi:hypothetical protein